ncbi:hypothetical protein T11_5621 [Trichinella zimbabwensis]|uniref:Uncharacterized protein n=1 Tax=Trichinella zimbabwensis TaxID=268475 RepID=A0A0V1H4I5_9BILA|nr:hypothetical protein T11_5621 [Trichinella zimbabwensis]
MNLKFTIWNIICEEKKKMEQIRELNSEALRSMINSSNPMLSHVLVGVEKAYLQVELNLEKFGFG